MSEWELTKDVWDALLRRLDPDPAAAGQKYEAIRAKLIRFFEWRQAPVPDDCADETIDRVARKIQQGDQIEEMSSYFYGVARMILLERVKRHQKQQEAISAMPPPEPLNARPESEDRSLECLDRCMKTLPADHREIILDYYMDEKGAKIERRKSLADRLQIPLNALRIRAHRIRGRIEDCVARCVQSDAA